MRTFAVWVAVLAVAGCGTLSDEAIRGADPALNPPTLSEAPLRACLAGRKIADHTVEEKAYGMKATLAFASKLSDFDHYKPYATRVRAYLVQTLPREPGPLGFGGQQMICIVDAANGYRYLASVRTGGRYGATQQEMSHGAIEAFRVMTGKSEPITYSFFNP